MLACMESRLTPPAFWILTVLATGRRHGYDILRETERMSGGEVSLRVATLYSALERLEREGLIAPDGEEIVNGRARRYFVLTDDGSAQLAAEVERLEAATVAARASLASRARPAFGAIAALPSAVVSAFEMPRLVSIGMPRA